MKWLLVCVVFATGCSLVYESDPFFDGASLRITEVDPPWVWEGQTDVTVVLSGAGISDDATVEVVFPERDVPGPDLDGAIVEGAAASARIDQIGMVLDVPVLEGLAAGEQEVVRLIVRQLADGELVQTEAELELRGLDEFGVFGFNNECLIAEGTGTTGDFGPCELSAADVEDELYSVIRLANLGSLTLRLVGDEPIALRATREIRIGFGAIDGSGSDGGPGAGGCAGGGPGLPGTCAGGGPAGGATPAGFGRGGVGGSHSMTGGRPAPAGTSEINPTLIGDPDFSDWAEEHGHGGGGGVGSQDGMIQGRSGGHGGGLLLVHAARVLLQETEVLVRGGPGQEVVYPGICSVPMSEAAGGGGGGSGGGVWIRATRELAGNRFASALGGDGGGTRQRLASGDTQCVRGGHGAPGRIRVDGRLGDGIGRADVIADSEPTLFAQRCLADNGEVCGPALAIQQSSVVLGPVFSGRQAIVKQALARIRFSGETDRDYFVFLNGELVDVVAPFAGIGESFRTLEPGENEVCVRMTEDADPSREESGVCRRFFYAPVDD